MDLGAGRQRADLDVPVLRWRPAVPAHRRLGHSRRRRHRFDQRRRARSLADALLHDDRPQPGGRADQRRPADFTLEALRLYTEGAAWFSFDEHHTGSFHEGKYADLAVLSHDYLSRARQTIRRIESVLTLLGGSVVHATGPFAGLAANGASA
jgi:hypothetical protein